MNYLDTREWLITNGLGSFASGTVCDARTRTYHGWLIAALYPPTGRTLLLSHIDANLEVAGQSWTISTNFWSDGIISPLGYQILRSFEIEPTPTWIWGDQDWQLTRQLIMPYGLGKTGEDYQLNHQVLIQYKYEGNQPATLRLRPLIGDRDFHHQQSSFSGLKFRQVVGQKRICLQGTSHDWMGTPWQLSWSQGQYQVDGLWYWNYYYPEENRRGLGAHEDLYSPGYITVTLYPGETVTLEARVVVQGRKWSEEITPDTLNEILDQQSNENTISADHFEQALAVEQQRLTGIFNSILGNYQSEITNPKLPWQLLRASDQFIVHRLSVDNPTVIAGYPWFNDWGRDTLIALPGLALTTKRFDLAKGLLETFGRYCQNGLIPNTFPDAGSEPIYNSIDATLWWIETLGLYLEATQDWDFLAQQYPIVRQIYKAFIAGTLFNIRVDATDGLLTWDASDVALTWMDVVIDGQPVTPRTGKTVEVNSLWYSALCWAKQWAEQLAYFTGDQAKLQHQARHYEQKAQQVKSSLTKFWNPTQKYFYDRITPDDQLDGKIRPNAVLALSVYHCGFNYEQAQSVLQVARDRLLTPYGLRSLDPSDPDYIGRYSGDRWHRDRAYHQGTVWSWLIGSFIRAWRRFHDTEPIPFDWQPLLEHFEQEGCLNSISEIFDGDYPHHPQGAFAQAWSVAELIRYYL